MCEDKPVASACIACPNSFIGLPPLDPRLLVPLASSRIQSSSFRLYNPGSSRGKLFKWCGWIAAATGLLKFAGRFCSAPIDSFPSTDNIQPILDNALFGALQRTWERILGKGPVAVALSLGTPDDYRKITALVFDQEATSLAFAKIGCTPQAISLIAHERKALEMFSMLPLQHAIVPTLLGQGTTGPATWLLQSALLTGRPSPVDLQKVHIDFLTDLARSTRRMAAFHTTCIWEKLQCMLKKPVLPIKSGLEAEKPFISELVHRFQASGIHEMAGSWPVSAAHGDFAPWNMRLAEGKIALFDWEYFLPEAPLGWDLLYFLFRVDNLIKKKPFEQIWSEFKTGIYLNILNKFENEAGLQVPDQQLLATFVLLTIALDLIPRWICGGKTDENSPGP